MVIFANLQSKLLYCASYDECQYEYRSMRIRTILNFFTNFSARGTYIKYFCFCNSCQKLSSILIKNSGNSRDLTKSGEKYQEQKLTEIKGNVLKLKLNMIGWVKLF